MQTETPTTPAKVKRKYERKVKVTSALDPVAALQTPEGQALLTATVARIMGELADKRAELGTEPQDGDMSLVRKLALAIGEVSDQGNSRKRVAPEVLEKRRMARDRMETLIIDARAADESPEYYVNRTCYLAEELVYPTYMGTDKVVRRTRIGWPHVPNEGLEPANDVAKAIHLAFIESIGGLTPAVRGLSAPGAPKGRESDLRVLHKSEQGRQVSEVGKPRGSGLHHVGRALPGEIIETQVLGTLQAPARQLA